MSLPSDTSGAGFHDKAVAQIMNAWAMVIGGLAQSDLVG